MITNYDSNYKINIHKSLSYDDIYKILINSPIYEFNNIMINIKNLNEIKNNVNVFSYIFQHSHNLIIPYIEIDKNVVLQLNKDLMIFYKNNIDVEISDLKLINFINFYKNCRKYKYENIPNNFDSKIYIELNKDLSNMTESQATSHYENHGYKENRKYKLNPQNS